MNKNKTEEMKFLSKIFFNFPSNNFFVVFAKA